MATDPTQQPGVPPEVLAAARAADAKGAREVIVLEVGPVSAVASWFVICSAASDRQVKAVADAVEEGVAEVAGQRPLGVEGRDTLEWVLLNYGDVLVHVFRQETREFYDLERLWADAAQCDWQLPASTPAPVSGDERSTSGPAGSSAGG